MRIAGALPRTEACGVSVVPPVYSLHGARFVYYTLLVHIHQGMVLARTLKCAFARLVGKSFGSLLYEYRKKARLSVQQLAQESELDRKYVYELEKGFSQPTLATMFRLANALAVDCTEMVARTQLLVARGSPGGRARRKRGSDGSPVPSDSEGCGETECEEK